MEIGIDRNEWQSRAGTGNRSCPDWHDLKARLVAADATRRVMARAQDALGADLAGHQAFRFGGRRGSFSPRCAVLLAARNQRFGGVNPVSSGHRKRALAMVHSFAGTFSTGGRGQE